MNDGLTYLTVANILQPVLASYHHVVHLPLTLCCLSTISPPIELGKRKKTFITFTLLYFIPRQPWACICSSNIYLLKIFKSTIKGCPPWCHDGTLSVQLSRPYHYSPRACLHPSGPSQQLWQGQNSSEWDRDSKTAVVSNDFECPIFVPWSHTHIV